MIEADPRSEIVKLIQNSTDEGLVGSYLEKVDRGQE